MTTSTTRLILASTSRYRQDLLARFGLPFDTARPAVHEQALPGEAAEAMALRLALAKAQAVAADTPDAWVLGSDQVAELDGRAIGKPGHRTAACAQLSAMAGRQVRFHTAVALARAGHATTHACQVTTVVLRALSPAQIARYVDAEQPFDCAGSFKCEGLGIVLFEAIHSDDPTGLIGLPLIATARLLRAQGFALP